MVKPSLSGLRDRITMLVGRGVLAALGAAQGSLMRGTLTGVAGETLGGREFALDYGMSCRPHPGAEALMLFLAGLRSNGVIVRLMDRRYTISLEEGEIALHDDLGQRVHLTRTGINVTSPLNITVQAGQTLRLAGQVVQIHADRKLTLDTHGYGNAITWAGGVAWELKSWTAGAVTSSVTMAISPPEKTDG